MDEPENKPVLYKHGDLLISADDLQKLCEENGLLPVPRKQLELLLMESKKLSVENLEFKNSVVDFIQGVEKFQKDYEIEKLVDNPMRIPGFFFKMKKKFSKPGAVEKEFGSLLAPIIRIANLCKLQNNLDFFKPKNNERRLTEPAKKND